jgi:hypothetical protein
MGCGWSRVAQVAVCRSQIEARRQVMSQLLRDSRPPTTRSGQAQASPERLRRPLVIVAVVVALLFGTTGGWAAFSLLERDRGPGIEEIQRARAEAMVDHYEQWWQRTRPRELERLRHEAMVDHYERRWRAEQSR